MLSSERKWKLQGGGSGTGRSNKRIAFVYEELVFVLSKWKLSHLPSVSHELPHTYFKYDWQWQLHHVSWEQTDELPSSFQESDWDVSPYLFLKQLQQRENPPWQRWDLVLVGFFSGVAASCPSHLRQWCEVPVGSWQPGGLLWLQLPHFPSQKLSVGVLSCWSWDSALSPFGQAAEQMAPCSPSSVAAQIPNVAPNSARQTCQSSSWAVIIWATSQSLTVFHLERHEGFAAPHSRLTGRWEHSPPADSKQVTEMNQLFSPSRHPLEADLPICF